VRQALIGLFILVATLAGNTSPGNAYAGSFFNDRYCTMPGGGSWGGSGVADCSYNTWEQCRASARGLGRYCTENPFWKSEGSGGNGRTPRRRTMQQR
jgi:hypothetical protein